MTGSDPSAECGSAWVNGRALEHSSRESSGDVYLPTAPLSAVSEQGRSLIEIGAPSWQRGGSIVETFAGRLHAIDPCTHVTSRRSRRGCDGGRWRGASDAALTG
jgi:hypothetical protein